MDQKKEIGFVIACRQFFGQKQGQGLAEFQAEVKELTEKDREDMRPGLEAALGCTIKL